MKVRDVMTAPAITVGPDTAYGEIVHCLLSNNISGVPVTDETGQLLGIVTEADLVLREAYGEDGRRALALVGEVIQGHPAAWLSKVAASTARDLMSRDPIVTDPDDDLADAARRMLRKPCKRLPVVRDGRVIGIVSRHDILRRFERPDRDLAIEVSTSLPDLVGATASGVEFSVADGIVTLRGSIGDPAEARALHKAVAAIDGVIRVDDQIESG